MKHLRLFILANLLLIISCSMIFGQMARKPSPTREPKGAMSKKPDSNQNSLAQIKSQKEFDLVGRVYHQGTPFAMPHVMFVVDRKNANKIYFVNSQKFRFHKDFLYATGLAPLGTDIYKAAYFNVDRRFIVGTVAWQQAVSKWTWELWEGDLANADHIKTANTVINKTFFQPVAYKPNSNRQDDASANLGIPRISQDEISKNQPYLALNTGKAIGRIHIIDKLDDTVEIGDNEILILKELPESLPQVKGIIVAKPSTPLSHVNILAKGWNIPNIYIKDADKIYKDYDTWWVDLDAKLTDFKIKRLVDYKPGEAPKIPDSPFDQVAPSNLNVKKLATLREMRKKDSLSYGGKSANLGELLNSKVANIVVPDAFTVPFYWYEKFMKDNGFNQIVETQEEENDFVHNPRYRRGKLKELQTKIMGGKFDESLKAEIISKWKTELGGKPVFVRSSSNAEDLPNFSGAGLYSSKPNVLNEEQLIEGVKYVWASLWNDRAYEARVRNYVDQKSVFMSALIQVGINMDKGGVMFSKDPFDKENKNTVYISSVCGHNDPITANNGMPEQVLVKSKSNVVILMTYSQIENTLKFDEKIGGLKATNIPCRDQKTKRILTDAQARLLTKIALDIRQVFGGKKEQDIEWGIMNGKVYIVQSRPYIEKN